MECSTAETPCDTAKASKKEPVRNFMRTGSFLSAAFRTWGNDRLFVRLFLPYCQNRQGTAAQKQPSSGLPSSSVPRISDRDFSSSGRPLAAAASSKAALNKMQKYCIHGQAASGASSAGAAAVMVSDCALMMRWAASSTSSWVRVTRSPTFRITADGLAWALMA